ncbi:hypothetical protein VINE108521_13995 [Vibrio neonatus]
MRLTNPPAKNNQAKGINANDSSKRPSSATVESPSQKAIALMKDKQSSVNPNQYVLSNFIKASKI